MRAHRFVPGPRGPADPIGLRTCQTCGRGIAHEYHDPNRKDPFEIGDRVRIATYWLREHGYLAEDHPYMGEVGRVLEQYPETGRFLVEFPSATMSCHATALERVD